MMLAVFTWVRKVSDMSKPLKTPENLQKLIHLDFEQGWTYAACAEFLQVSERTLYNWKNSEEYKEAKAAYVVDLEDDAIPSALTTLVREAKLGNVKAAGKLMDIYKGVKSRVGVEGSVEVLIREVLNGSNGRNPTD